MLVVNEVEWCVKVVVALLCLAVVVVLGLDDVEDDDDDDDADGVTRERNASMISWGWRLVNWTQWVVLETAAAFARMNASTCCFSARSLAWSLTSNISMALSIFSTSNIVDLASWRSSFRSYLTAARKRSIGLRFVLISSLDETRRPV